MKTHIFYKVLKLKILETAIDILFNIILTNFKDPGNKVLPQNLYVGQQLKTIREIGNDKCTFNNCIIHTIAVDYERSCSPIPLYAISFSYSSSSLGIEFDKFTGFKDTVLINKYHVEWEFIE